MHTAFLCLGALGLLQTLLLLHFTHQWLRGGALESASPPLRTFAANLVVGPLLVVNGILMLALEFGGSPRSMSVLYVAATAGLYMLALGFLNGVRWLQIVSCGACALATLAMSGAVVVPMAYGH